MTETNQPAPLYRLHYCKDKLPEKEGYYNTDKGRLYNNGVFRNWLVIKDTEMEKNPEWWLEEVPVPTDEKIDEMFMDNGNDIMKSALISQAKRGAKAMRGLIFNQ